MKTFLTLTLSAIALAWGTTASAAVLADGIYQLGNHPDGQARPPVYGLRLDGLDGNNSSIFTFDFTDDAADSADDGAAMFMDVDTANSRIRIWGTAYGGLDVGSAYDGTVSGLWDIDFTYSANITVGGNIVVGPDSPSNDGTITSQFTAGTFTAGNAIRLVDKADNTGISFEIDTNHRGFSGFSGWGWMNHEVGGLDTHIAASDWLFTVGPSVPVPGALLLGALGLSLIGAVKRRLS